MDGQQSSPNSTGQVKKRVLFLSVHNSTRSQMAEALLHDLSEGAFDVFSAGTEPTEINQFAIDAMQEVGISIVHCQSKPVELYAQRSFDYVVVLCAPSSERCPSFPNARQSFTWNFANPLDSGGSDDEKLQKLRDFRDALSQKISQELLPLK